MANISSDATKILNAASPEAKQWVMGQSYGERLTSGETQKLLSQYNANPSVTVPTQAAALGGSFSDTIKGLTSQSYSFDASKFLPGIQTEAKSIYDPQKQGLETQREIEKMKAEDAKIEQEQQFQERMQQETEAINRRGAFFSGGAIQNEQKIRTEQAMALKQLGLQSMQNDLQITMGLANLTNEEAKYVRDRLVGENASAYQMWANQRQFTLDGVLALQSQYNADRAYQMEQEKFAESTSQWNKTYELTKKELKMKKEKQKDDLKTSAVSRLVALNKSKGTGNGKKNNDDGTPDTPDFRPTGSNNPLIRD